jgi:hypothetical protein
MAKRIVLTALAVVMAMTTLAQATDKHDADLLVYKELTANYETTNWHPDLIVTKDMLKDTDEKGVYIVKGDSFQVKSIRSDFYVREENGKWTPLNDTRYPMETMTNLLLDRIDNNKHKLELRHHQYGGAKPKILIPMQNFHDLFAQNMQMYCSVTFIDRHELRAVLVLHQKKMDFIHMVEMKIPTKRLTNPESTITGELYTNIPQGNLKSIFREKKQFIK